MNRKRAQHQQLGLGVGPGAARRCPVPGRADLEPAVLAVDGQVARRADWRAVEFAHQKCQPTRVLQRQHALHPASRRFRRRRHGEPQRPRIAIGCRTSDFGDVVSRQRLQPHPPRAGESHRLDESAHRGARADARAENSAHSEQTAAAPVAPALM